MINETRREAGEPTLADILHDLWRAKLYVLIFAALGLIAAFGFITVSTPHYKAQMIVAPADGYALGDYASNASLGQSVSLPFWRPSDPEGVSTDYYRFIHTVNGASVAEILLKDEGVLSGIRKSAGKQDWIAEELAAYLNKNIRIEQLGATPLRRISYMHPDRSFAAALLRKINLVADQMIRRDRKRQSESRVKYLNTALNTTNNPDHRKIITNLLMQQEHVRMLANLDEAYAAIVVEPASTGAKAHWPNPKLIYPIAFLFGGFIGFLFWSLGHSGCQLRHHD